MPHIIDRVLDIQGNNRFFTLADGCPGRFRALVQQSDGVTRGYSDQKQNGQDILKRLHSNAFEYFKDGIELYPTENTYKAVRSCLCVVNLLNFFWRMN